MDNYGLMKVNTETNYKVNLAYSYMLALNYISQINNLISEKTALFLKKNQYKVPKQNISFHHTKLERRVLLSQLDDIFAKINNLNAQDKFDSEKCDFIMPFLEEYAKKSGFKEFYTNKIQPLEIKKTDEKKHLIIEGLNLAEKYWDSDPPNRITIINNALRDGGHLNIIGKKEDVFLTINLFNQYDNMIRYLVIHEFSHYFQNKLFLKIQDKIEEKEYLFSHRNEEYGEWQTWFSENLIEAVIFSLIRPPPENIYNKQFKFLREKYDLVENIVNTIKNEKFEKIGEKEIVIILKNLK